MSIVKVHNHRKSDIRKNGLFKKAYELGVLCSVDVAVIIFDEKPGQQQKLYEYSSSNIRDIVKRHVRYIGDRDSRVPSDFSGEGGAGSKVDDHDEDGEADEEELEDEPVSKKGRKGNKDDRRPTVSTTQKSSTTIPTSSSRHTHHSSSHSHKRKRSRSRSSSLSLSRSRSSSPARSPRRGAREPNPLSLPTSIPTPRSEHNDYQLPSRGSINSPHETSRPGFDYGSRGMGGPGYQGSGNGYQFPAFHQSASHPPNMGGAYNFTPPSPAPSSGGGVPSAILQGGGSFNDIMDSRGVFGPPDRGVFEAPNRPVFGGGGGGVGVIGGITIPNGEVLDVKMYRQMLLDQQMQAQSQQQQTQSTMHDLFSIFSERGGQQQQQQHQHQQPPPYSLSNVSLPVDWPSSQSSGRHVQATASNPSHNWLDFLSGPPQPTGPPPPPSSQQQYRADNISMLGDIFGASAPAPQDDDSGSEYDPSSRISKRGGGRTRR
uniref:MADS-box domain-containing protein n=1 Tax=Moniliophthora roreri TaxID=221103 RepID=A0A0W0EZQ3_MONRR